MRQRCHQRRQSGNKEASAKLLADDLIGLLTGLCHLCSILYAEPSFNQVELKVFYFITELVDIVQCLLYTYIMYIYIYIYICF